MVKVEEATDWSHPLVVVPKKKQGEARLTFDFTKLSNQIRHPVHPVLSPAEAISRIRATAKYFSVMDALSDY